MLLVLFYIFFVAYTFGYHYVPFVALFEAGYDLYGYCHLYLQEEEEDVKEEEKIVEEKYENKYYEKFLQTKKEIEWTDFELNEIANLEIKLQRREVQKEMKDFQAMAKKVVLEEKLAKLRNNIVLEKTPLGNVVMYYDVRKESFVYYSDNTIPYRFLDAVGRKYVITFRCAHLFVDINETKREKVKTKENDKEVKVDDDTKKEEEKEEKEDKEEKEEEEPTKKPKKNVFAKFKSYNKDTTKTTVGIPPKTNNTNRGSVVEEENTGTVIDENATNRYTWEGKMLDFPFLQKVDKTKVDKRLALSFADYKKLQSNI